MPSETTLNAKNLAALGAERLAELLLDVIADDAAAKRRLRLELASRGGGDVASEIRKRLVSVAKSRSFVDWRKVKDLEGTTLEHVATLAVPLDGQAWDWDRSAPRTIYGLANGGGTVVSMTIPIVPLLPEKP